MTANEWIERLGLEPHPEGGFYRESWRSDLKLPADVLPQKQERAAGTAIYFLLPSGVESAWHRVKSDELWIHQYGDSLILKVGEIEDHDVVHLGPDGQMQSVVPAHAWQSARTVQGDAGYALLCCVVVPGFDFEDFEMLAD